jgi:hypothetical protein
MDILVYVLIALCILLPLGTKVANEHERFIITVLGKYGGMKGPGLLFKFPGTSTTTWTRIALNDKGEYLGDGFVKVNRAVFPAINTEGLSPGTQITINSFSGGNISVTKSA